VGDEPGRAIALAACTSYLAPSPGGFSLEKAMPVKALFNLMSRTQPRADRVPEGVRVYAVGDIHGRLDLLEALLATIAADDRARGAGAETHYIFLGDLIDRGPDSRGVVERLLAFSMEGRNVRFLMGNHEQVFLRAMAGDLRALRFLIRIGGHTVSFAMAANEQNAKLEALEHVPMGSVVVSMVGRECRDEWPMERNAHIGAMVMVRRHGFSNDQWITEGVNLLQLKSRFLGAFSADPSEIVRPTGCRTRPWWISRALTYMPRDKVDYLWLVTPPPFDPALVDGMKVVWRGPDSVLYKVNP
jgi:hypothetical protein